MLKWWLTTGLFLLCQVPRAQYTPGLLDTVLQGAGLFVRVKPVGKIWLDIRDTADDRRYLQEEYHYNVDPDLLIELIGRCAQTDTTLWTHEELACWAGIALPCTILMGRHGAWQEW
jgi:hypothetical protein